MIWTSPKRSDAYRSATHQRQAYFDEKNRKSNVTTPKSDSTDTTTSRPLHNNTHTAAQRLQSRTRSNYGQSRPSISMSFTTYSSDIRGREIESRSISPPYPSHISQTLLLTPSIGSLLPSPPEEITICRSYSPETTGPSFIETPSGTYSSSQQTYDQDSQLSHIPSAQPYGYTPLGYSPPPMSSPSLLPSPPMTQSTEEGFRSYQPPMSPTFSASSRRYSSLTGRRLPDDSAISDSRLDDLPESELFDSVLEGIGRIHVSMGRDDAGRWRIQRATDERP